jgi:predicted Zn-dependent protease
MMQPKRKCIFLKQGRKTLTLWFIFILAVIIPPAFATKLSPYSNKELEQLEKEFVQLINQSDLVDREPLAAQYINSLGKKLARHGHISSPYFFIVKSKEINAFAGPGGYIGINTQLILTTDTESELAAVMAHELAHVRLHHLYSMIDHQKQMRIPMLASLLASAALGVINPTVGMGAMMASMSGFSQDNINFTRSKEKESDRIGINMLSNAGFNPQGMAKFFRKMQENSRYYYTENIPAILRTHPMDDERIAEAENRINRLKTTNHQSSLDYSLFKELIRTQVATDNRFLIDYYQHQCAKNNTTYICEYGLALTHINNNNYQQAVEHLKPLLSQHTENLYIPLAIAQAEIGLKQYKDAITRLAELHTLLPENYAVLMAYSQSLLAGDQTEKATSLLLKGSRQYTHDLPLCYTLARAQAQSGKKSYAYFTQAQCLVLEGQPRAAIAQLKVAQNMAKKDEYLTARITAKIDEIKFMTED